MRGVRTNAGESDNVEAADQPTPSLRQSSELRELGDEAGAEKWLSFVNDLASRLASARS